MHRERETTEWGIILTIVVILPVPTRIAGHVLLLLLSTTVAWMTLLLPALVEHLVEEPELGVCEGGGEEEEGGG